MPIQNTEEPGEGIALLINFVGTCYSEWGGSGYECPFCNAGKRKYWHDRELLRDVSIHSEDCTWRRAYLLISKVEGEHMKQKTKDAVTALQVLKGLIDSGASIAIALQVEGKNSVCLYTGADFYGVITASTKGSDMNDVHGVKDFRDAFIDFIATAQALDTSAKLLGD